MNKLPYQSIHEWSISGQNRVVGSVHNRPGVADGKTIMTSPVLEIRLMGDPKMPVAFTESGNAYWLCEPSNSFGFDKAEAFVWEMSRSDRVRSAPAEAKPDPLEQTTILKRL
jgi:hypothetical protein